MHDNDRKIDDTTRPAASRKPFVEPAISVPQDALEATALFLAASVVGSTT